MTCDELRDGLERRDPVSGVMERHLATCPECRQYRDDLDALTPHVGNLPRSVAPARPLWEGIERRLARPAPSRFRYLLPLAAALVLAAAALLWNSRRSGGGAPAFAPQVFTTHEDAWLHAADELESVLAEGRLLPVAVAAVRRDLEVLDQAILEAREALAAEPDNELLRELYRSVTRRRLDVLRHASQFASS